MLVERRQIGAILRRYEAMPHVSDPIIRIAAAVLALIDLHPLLAAAPLRGDNDAEERVEELRILEALLFAAEEPLDEKALGGRLPAGVDVRALLVQLQKEYAPRGVNLVRVGGKWSLRTAGDLAWLLTREIDVYKRQLQKNIESALRGGHTANFLDLGAGDRLVIGDDGERFDRGAREFLGDHHFARQKPGEIAGRP